MPGHMRADTPAARQAVTSSAVRPKIAGSPPFSRTTRLPSSAAVTISMLLFDFVVDQSAAKLLSKLGVDEASQSCDRPSDGLEKTDNVVRLK